MDFEKKYDALFKEVEDFLKDANPCNICNGTCYRGQVKNTQSFCCGNGFDYEKCKYLGKKGCKADKPLVCKLWLCDEATSKLTDEQWETLHKLRGKAEDLLMGSRYMCGMNRVYFRTSKQEAIAIRIKNTKKI